MTDRAGRAAGAVAGSLLARSTFLIASGARLSAHLSKP